MDGSDSPVWRDRVRCVLLVGSWRRSDFVCDDVRRAGNLPLCGVLQPVLYALAHAFVSWATVEKRFPAGFSAADQENGDLSNLVARFRFMRMVVSENAAGRCIDRFLSCSIDRVLWRAR